MSIDNFKENQYLQKFMLKRVTVKKILFIQLKKKVNKCINYFTQFMILK